MEKRRKRTREPVGKVAPTCLLRTRRRPTMNNHVHACLCAYVGFRIRPRRTFACSMQTLA